MAAVNPKDGADKPAITGLQLLTAKETAPILGVTLARLYEMVRDRIVPPGPVVRFGRQIRFNPEALEEWLKSGGTEWRHEG